MRPTGPESPPAESSSARMHLDSESKSAADIPFQNRARREGRSPEDLASPSFARMVQMDLETDSPPLSLRERFRVHRSGTPELSDRKMLSPPLCLEHHPRSRREPKSPVRSLLKKKRFRRYRCPIHGVRCERFAIRSADHLLQESLHPASDPGRNLLSQSEAVSALLLGRVKTLPLRHPAPSQQQELPTLQLAVLLRQ